MSMKISKKPNTVKLIAESTTCHIDKNNNINNRIDKKNLEYQFNLNSTYC